MTKGIDELRIYKLAGRLDVFVHKVTARFPEDEKYRSVDQLRRSSSSSTNNISESYYRYHYNDKINRLIIARGEAGETREGIIRAQKKGLCSKIIADFTYCKYTELIKGINSYINFLRNKRDNKFKNINKK